MQASLLVQLAANGLWAGSLLAVIAVGYSLFRRCFGVLSLAPGIAFAAGAYTAHVATKSGHSVGGVAFGMLAGGVALVVLELSLFGPLRHRGLSQDNELLISVGLFATVQHMLSLAFGDRPLAAQAGPRFTVEVFGAVWTIDQVWLSALLFGSITAAFLFLSVTRLGLAIRAFGDNPDLARLRGLPIHLMLVAAAGLPGALFGLAGAATAVDTTIMPNSGLPAVLLAAIIVLAGHRRGIITAACVGICFGILSEGLTTVLTNQWRNAAANVLLLAIVLATRLTPARV